MTTVSTEAAPPGRSRWPWLSLLPIGFGAWAPLYAGVRARVTSWILLGVFWCAVAVSGWTLATVSTSHGHQTGNDFAGFLMILAWAGAAATSFVIRPSYDRRMGSPMLAASQRAEERLRERRKAQELARRNPSLAREMGIGRPDIPGAADAGLVDLNAASAAAMSKLPGIDDEIAARIVRARADTGGFSSLEDLGIALDLPGDVVEDLRDRAVFLPRQADPGS
jgi:Helix-hairpin-helix motif